MFSLLKPHPAHFRWALRFYGTDTRALDTHPKLPEVIERTFPSFQQLDLEVILPYFKSLPQIVTYSGADIGYQWRCDPSVPPAQSDLIAELVKGAQKVVIHGAGHLPFTERRWMTTSSTPFPLIGADK